MIDLSKFTIKAADWRAQLRRNRTRTAWVIAIFILFYLAIGLLIDVYIYSSSYPQVDLGNIFLALITLQVAPKVTLITLGIALISLWVTYTFYDKIMLLGTDYREITPETA